MIEEVNLMTVRFSLGMWGRSLSPDVVTNVLGISPDTSYKKGYVKKLSSGNYSKPKDLGIWTVDYIVKNSFERELDTFIRRLKVDSLLNIDGVETVIFDIYLGLSDDEYVIKESFEYFIDNNLVSRISALGAGIRITVV